MSVLKRFYRLITNKEIIFREISYFPREIGWAVIIGSRQLMQYAANKKL